MKELKMKHHLRIATCVVLVLIAISGCATEPSPAKGGLFDGIVGLVSGKYKERVNERKQHLTDLQEENLKLCQENQVLRSSLIELQPKEDSSRQELDKLRDDLNGLERRLRDTEVTNSSKRLRKKELEKKLDNLTARINDKVNSVENPASTVAVDDIVNLKVDRDSLAEQIGELRRSSEK